MFVASRVQLSVRLTRETSPRTLQPERPPAQAGWAHSASPLAPAGSGSGSPSRGSRRGAPPQFLLRVLFLLEPDPPSPTRGPNYLQRMLDYFPPTVQLSRSWAVLLLHISPKEINAL